MDYSLFFVRKYLCFSLCFALLCGMNVQAQTEQISESFPIQNVTTFLDAAPTEKLQLYRSFSGMSTEPVEIESGTTGEIYLVDNNAGTITALTLDKDLFDYPAFHATFVSENQQVLISAYSGWVTGALRALYIYDIATQTARKIELGDLGQINRSRIDIADSGKVIYYSDTETVIYRYDVSNDNLTQLELPENQQGSQCPVEYSVASETDKLVLFCSASWFTYRPDGDWLHFTTDVISLWGSQQHVLSGDGKKVIFHHRSSSLNDKLYSLQIEGELEFSSYRPDNRIFSAFDLSLVGVNLDGTKVLVSSRLQRTALGTSNSNETYLLDTLTQKAAYIGFYNSHLDEAYNSFHGFIGEHFYFSSVHRDIGRNTYRINMEDAFSIAESTIADDFTLTSSEPLTVDISFAGDNLPALLKRSSLLESNDRYFLASTTDVRDEMHGLSATEHDYDYFPCNQIYYCEDSNQFSKAIQVQDFDSPPELTAQYSENSNDASRGGSISINTESLDPAIQTRVTKYGVTSGTALNHVMDSHATYLAQFCRWDSLSSRYGCGGYSEPLHVRSPLNSQKPEVKILPDLTGVRIEWPGNFGTQYQLYRIVDSDTTMIYEGTDTVFVDDENLLGQSVAYRVLTCNDMGCASNDSGALVVARRETSLEIDTDEVLSDNGIEIDINTDYYFDEIQLFRIGLHDSTRVQIATLPGNSDSFIDVPSASRGQWIYEVVACYQGNCDYRTQTRWNEHTSGAISIPHPPRNIAFDPNKWHLAGDISWLPVEGVDGYRVTVTAFDDRGSNDVTQIDVDSEATSLAYFYGGSIGHRATIIVQSFVDGEEANEKNFSSAGEISNVLLMHTGELPSELAAPSFSVIPRVSNQQQSSAFDFEINEGFVYFVYAKSELEQDYTRYPIVLNWRNENNFEHAPPAELQQPVSYSFKMQACSVYLQTCVWFANQEETTYYPNYDLSEANAPPVVNVDAFGRFLISPQDSDEFDFQYLNVRRRSGVVYRGEYQDTVAYAQSDIEPGEEFSFSTQSCLVVRPSYYYAGEGVYCTEFSENTVFTVPADYVSIPQREPNLNYRLDTLPDLSYELVLSSYTYHSEYSRDSFSEPSFINVWRAEDAQEFELLAQVSMEDFISNQQQELYVDRNVPVDAWVHYQIQFCNEQGCGPSSDSRVVYVPNLQGISAPSLPVVRAHRDSEFDTSLMVNVELGDDTHSLNLRWNTRQEFTNDQINRTYAFQDLVRQQGILNLTDTLNLRLDSIWVTVQACRQQTCSDWTAPIEVSVSQTVSNNLSVSGDDWQNFSIGSRHSEEELFARISGGGLASRYQKTDTFQGHLLYNGWVYLDDNTVFETEIFLNPDQQHNCKTLFSQGIGLRDELSLRRSRELRVSRNIIDIVYTGNGCQSSQYPELFSYYIDSDFLDNPVLISDKTVLENQWLTVAISLDEQQKLHFAVSGLDNITSDKTLSIEVFALSNVFWQTDGETAFSRISVNSGEVADNLNVEINPWHDYQNVYPIHPTAFAFLDDSDISEVFSINTRLEKDRESQFLTTFNFDGSQEQTEQVLQDLEPGSEYFYLFNRCDSTQCGPYFTKQIRLPEYGVLERWRNPYRYFPQETPGELQITLFGFEGHAETVALYYRADNETDFKEAGSGSYLSFLLNGSNSVLSGQIVVTVADLDPNLTYQFKATICNPNGCLETPESSYYVVPKDSDADGVIDENDEFPEDPNEWQDTDDDGIGNNADDDDDDDGIPDSVELEAGLDPLRTYDAYADLDGDGYSSLMEYLAGTDMTSANQSPLDVGRFYSFEDGIEPDLVIDGNVLTDNWAWHGDIRLVSAASENQITVTVPGPIIPGQAFFAARHYGSLIPTAKLDGETISIGRSYEEKRYSSNNWRVYTIAIEREAEMLELSFSFTAAGSEGAFSLDGIFVPDNAKNSVDYDFTGDGKADLALRDTRQTRTHILDLADSAQSTTRFGLQATDIPVSGDFDGDGKADIAVRRPANTLWYILRSSDNEIARHEFGKQAQDIPVPADYDGDGITDIAVRRPSNSMWYILRSSDGEIERHRFGLQAEDIPVPADYDGDGKVDVAVRRPSNSMWYILRSTDGEIERHRFGLQEADIPVPADYDGDGKADIAVRRPSSYMWYIRQSSDEQIQRIRFGRQEQDIPVIADYDGDGKADIAVRRPSRGFWYILNSADDNITRSDFGRDPEFVPVAAPIMTRMAMVSAFASGNRSTVSSAISEHSNVSDTERDYFEEVYGMTRELMGSEQ